MDIKLIQYFVVFAKKIIIKKNLSREAAVEKAIFRGRSDPSRSAPDRRDPDGHFSGEPAAVAILRLRPQIKAKTARLRVIKS